MANAPILWPEAPEHPSWNTPEVTRKILGEVDAGAMVPIPVTWARTCAFRVHRMRDELRKSWVGLGPLPDWLLAALIARENALLLGPPGVAKTEIATRTFELLGLSSPLVKDDLLQQSLEATGSVLSWWREREENERKTQKYFHYLLSRFTQPEELFGPVEISLLRQGILARVNFGLLTGPGVRAAFLDEIFKSSSSVLNTLLTLTQERSYFNWGGMMRSDLIMLIGASNEMPGGFGTGTAGVGSGGDDFQTLYAFLDRFPIRLFVPAASGTSDPEPENSDLAQAFAVAMRRESLRFSQAVGFHDRGSVSPDMPGINDVLLLGRCCFQHESGNEAPCLFETQRLRRFRTAFLRTATALQQEGTAPESGKITWTISPRKLRALYKIALAHALVRDDRFTGRTAALLEPSEEELHVFDLIWDAPTARNDLAVQTRANISEFWGDRR